ncbi:DUF917 domain-containing protein [Terrabacter terrigena]|uniref:DUF917 domain-containing protein n=1 Tax=Terrabacter terrigena TaxID=574718 RepID=A0ABW3N018_9MICO
MPLTLHAADLPTLSRGFALLSSGGGGSPHVAELILAQSDTWPVTVHSVDELDPATPCVAIGYIGSTLLLEERLPDADPFTPAIAAIERWLGVQSSAVCSIEGAGLNGLSTLQLAGRRTIVDADCMGRALPDLDQISLLVDALPGLVAATPTGAGGVVLVHAARPEDVERVLRTATSCNGGWAGFALGGFRVGDLAEHAIPDGIERARSLGQAIAASHDLRPEELASALGGTLLGAGRVMASLMERGAGEVHTYDVRTDGADVLRLVARSEFIALMRNGAVEAASPTIITVLDSVSRAPLQVDELAVGKDVIILGLPAPAWWATHPRRLARARPSRWGITGLEEVC